LLTLTISTSSALGSLCLGDGKSLLGYECWQKKTSHSEVITQTLEALLQKTGVRMGELKLLICSSGPGSFTGLRVGLSVTRSLAYSLKIPIITINDGLAIALSEPALTPTDILTVIDAQKNKVFAGIYKKHLTKVHEILAPTLLSPLEIVPFLKESKYQVLGDGLPLLNELFTPQSRLVPSAQTNFYPDAKTIHAYTHENILALPKISWNELLPLYLRASAAEEVRAEKLSKNT
jgi:tRNA threonylcarbamoyladenosine biosynthesis protein TsaB